MNELDLLKSIDDSLKKILFILDEPRAKIIKFFTLSGDKRRRIKEMNLKVTDQLPLLLTITDKFGNAAPVDGIPQWSLTDASLGALEVAEDGMVATFVPAGSLGALQVQVSVDADMGEGVRPILGVLDIEVFSGEAEVVTIAAGTPVPKP